MTIMIKKITQYSQKLLVLANGMLLQNPRRHKVANIEVLIYFFNSNVIFFLSFIHF